MKRKSIKSLLVATLTITTLFVTSMIAFAGNDNISYSRMGKSIFFFKI